MKIPLLAHHKHLIGIRNLHEALRAGAYFFLLDAGAWIDQIQVAVVP